MLSITGTNIKMTRGDTVRIALSVTDANGNTYTPSVLDTIVLSVKKSTDDTAYLFQKTITDGTILIAPTDTSTLEFGSYVYDVQLTLDNGDVNTIIPISELRIMQEVT